MAAQRKAQRETKAAGDAALLNAASAAALVRIEQSMIDTLPIGVALLRADSTGRWIIASANPMFEHLARTERRFVIGFEVVELHALDPDGALAEKVAAFGARLGGPPMDFDWKVLARPRDRHYAVRLAWVEGDGAARIQLSLRDRSFEVEQARALREEALRDPLTGLYNRIGFIEAIDAVGPSTRYAVLLLDLRGFSRINDGLGHTAADELLLTTARRLLNIARPHDIVARLVGDTFGILAPLVDGAGEVLDLAGNCHAVIGAPLLLSEREIHQPVSIGIAFSDDDQGCDGDEIVRSAEFAVHRAKRMGGGTEVYRRGEAQVIRRRFGMEGDLRRALREGGLSLMYQPLIRLSDGQVTAVEALARWTHPARGPIPPSDFIPLAEESGLIAPLGRWVMEQACIEMQSMRQDLPAAHGLQVAINISGIQFANDDIVDSVINGLEKSGLPGHALKLELTESAVIANPERAVKVLAALKRLDTRIAMDDFGTGYSSLYYLQRLPIDILKIDRSFVSHMLHDTDSHKIVHAMLSLARALRIETVAEGIETPQQARRLTEMGCDYGQGFYFARPLSANALRLFLTQRAAAAPSPTPHPGP